MFMSRGRSNFGFGFGFGVECGQMGTFGDIQFRPKAVVPHSVHFRFRRAAVAKFGASVVAESRVQSLSCGGRECAIRRESLASLCTD